MEERIYHWCKKILILPAWPTILIAVPSFAALIWYFVIGNTMQNMQLIEIPVYCLSAYVIRYRKYKSPVLSAVKAINLTTAMVTMLALETAMISQFGSADEESFRQIMTSITAAVVCVVEFVTAVYMIYNGTSKQRNI